MSVLISTYLGNNWYLQVSSGVYRNGVSLELRVINYFIEKSLLIDRVDAMIHGSDDYVRVLNSFVHELRRLEKDYSRSGMYVFTSEHKIDQYFSYLLDILRREETSSKGLEDRIKELTPQGAAEALRGQNIEIDLTTDELQEVVDALKKYVDAFESSISGPMSDRKIQEETAKVFEESEYLTMGIDELLDMRNELSRAPEINRDKIHRIDQILRTKVSRYNRKGVFRGSARGIVFIPRGN